MPITEQQRAERINYIGGSDAAAVLGMSRWSTPIELWSEKAGIVTPEDISKKMYIRLGHKLEPVVAELFEEETGKKLRMVNQTIYHKKYPFLAVNLDRRVVGEDAFVELKKCASWKRKEWENEEIPHEYLIQVQHGLMVTGDAYAYTGVLIGAEDFAWQRVERDEELIAMLEKREIEFWTKFVQPKLMPKVVQAPDTDVLNRIYPHQRPGSEINLPDEAMRIVESRQALLQDKANIVKMIDQADAEIKAYMGDHETGRAGRYKVTWKEWSKAAYMVKESSGRTLRVSEEKNNGNH